jgi:hypothetical protein
METKEWRYDGFDREHWGAGPWQQEPDALFWLDATTGLPCLVARGEGTGALCGYVGVPEGHPCHGKERVSPELRELDAHGGINFAAPIKTEFFEDEKYWQYWFIGFDCAHSDDFVPAQDTFLRQVLPGWQDHFRDFKVYREVPYVKMVVEELAAQLAAIKTGN